MIPEQVASTLWISVTPLPWPCTFPERGSYPSNSASGAHRSIFKKCTAQRHRAICLLRLKSPTHRLIKGGWRACGGRKSRLCFLGRPLPSPVEKATRRVPASQRWALILSLAAAEECMARRQRGTSRLHNHLQTALASGLAEEEDLLWGWRENKEQLCKLYGATL